MKIPRPQAVQGMLRIIYEDGTVGLVTAVSQEIPRDAMEPDIAVDKDMLIKVVQAQFGAVQDRIAKDGTDELYRQAKRESADRRASAAKTAREAHLKHQLGSKREEHD